MEPSVVADRYEIESELGKGGMGRLYVAGDRKLGRKVAIKMLAAGIQGEEAERRFEQEARAAGALNHPNILAVHDFGTWQGEPYIVYELLEGETLAERLRGGPLPLADTTGLALQLAHGLAAAHDKGIVHRDLKPENLFITKEGLLKILDFGIAKVAPAPLPDGQETLHSRPRTQTGTILGTVGYMSPEQVRGERVDLRSDFFSLGTILYEMLEGRTAFERDSDIETCHAILTDTPAPPSHATSQLQSVVRRCLEKKPEDRFQSARDLVVELETTSSAPRGIGALASLLLSKLRGGPAARRQPVLSQITFAEGIHQFPAWSPDGNQLAYTTEIGGVRKVFLKHLAGGEGRRLTSGDFDDIQPAWSPDGRTIVFSRSREAGKKLEPGDVFGQYYGGDIFAVDVASGKETRLLENAFNAAFSPDGSRLAVDAAWARQHRIWVANHQGFNPEQVTSDVSDAVAHVRPRWSPDGGRIVFQNIEKTKIDVRVVDLETRKLAWVTDDVVQDIGPVWSGKFIYFSSARGGGMNVWRLPVAADGRPAGALQQMTNGAGQDVDVAISADGKRIAFSTLRQNAQVWKLPVSPETGRPTGTPIQVIATTREDSRGAWSPDSKWIAFNSDRAGAMNIWLHSLEDGSTRQLTKGPGGDYQANWSPDGKRIVFFSSRAGTTNIWSVEIATGKLRQLTSGDSINANPFFSPDGESIAFHSDRSGQNEVWLMRADGSEPRQLTRVGAMNHFMRWMAAGRSIAFRCASGGKQVVEVPAEGGDPRPMAEISGGSHISFSPDASLAMDVVNHKVLWVSPLKAGKPERVFEFDDPDSRIDYPVWSPDGRWVLFDRFRPQGGDIWLMKDFE
jgi:Tol biopolymer transport system component